jgi:hypothetical protein
MVKDQLTPRVRVTPEHHATIRVLWIRKHLMQCDRESVQVADMQRAEVCMKRIVQQALVYREIHWWVDFRASCSRTCLCAR